MNYDGLMLLTLILPCSGSDSTWTPSSPARSGKVETRTKARGLLQSRLHVKDSERRVSITASCPHFTAVKKVALAAEGPVTLYQPQSVSSRFSNSVHHQQRRLKHFFEGPHLSFVVKALQDLS